MKSTINRMLPNSAFARNILTLFTGTTIAQAIPILIIPILTRIYSPEDFGILAIFVSLTGILGSIANGRYELAIMLPKKNDDVINIAALSFFVCSIFSLSLAVILFFFAEYIIKFIGTSELEGVIYLVPLLVWMTGIFNLINYLNTRLSNYKDLAKSSILKSLSLVVVQIVCGIFKLGPLGLILGQVAFSLNGNIKLTKNISKNYKVGKISKLDMRTQAKRYIDFPKYSMPGALANNLSSQFINILISVYFNVATLGFYSLSLKVLGMPSALLGGAISQVFFQEAAEEKNRTGNIINTFNKTVKKLILVAVPFFVILFFVVEELFSFFFGEEWRIAGSYAKIAIPMFAVRFVVASVSSVDTVMEKQSYFLVFNLVLLCASLLTIYFGKKLPFNDFLYAFSYVIMSVYLVYGFVLRGMAKNDI